MTATGLDHRAYGWQLDRAGALSYEETLVPVLSEWAAALVDAVAPPPGGHVVDVACGTGVVTRSLRAPVGATGRITAIDVSPAMLEVARERTPSQDPPVEWRLAAAEELPLTDATADAVLCQQGLQFFADPPAAIAQMRRVLVPGGRIGISTCGSLDRQPGYRPLVDLLDHHVGPDAAAVIASPYGLGDGSALRRLVEAAGFDDVRVQLDFPTFRLPSARALLLGEAASSPLGDLTAVADADTVEKLVRDLEQALAGYIDDDGLAFPFQTVSVTAAAI